MYVSKSFIVIMGAVTLFLLAAFATEEAQCIVRAERILRDMLEPVPAGVDGEIECLRFDDAPPNQQERGRPAYEAQESYGPHAAG